MPYIYKGMMLSDKKIRRRLRPVTLTFTRASVAYDYLGNQVAINVPRFTHLINGNIEYGLLCEDAHTNILTSGASLSLTSSGPYTTGRLTGTYTFQCEGTGSYVLSGGTTGTVSKDNPVTATISGATVTLTPATTSTLNQVINKEFPLSWTLGGTTQAKEYLSVPTPVLNLDPNGYSNMLPNTQANSLNSGSPYTTITLRASTEYTFSCGTGSYVLSGGLSGTVTPTNPVTGTPGATTVTLTGDSTLNQLSATSTVKPWLPGATHDNDGEWTIEFRFLANKSVKTDGLYNYLFDSSESTSVHRHIAYITTANNLALYYSGGSTPQTIYYADSNLTLNSWYNYCGTSKSSAGNAYVNGVSVGTPLTSVYLPTSVTSTRINGKWDDSSQGNTLIKDVVISKIYRSATSVSNRSSMNVNNIGFEVDKDVTLVAPLKSNLNAYMVKQ